MCVCLYIRAYVYFGFLKMLINYDVFKKINILGRIRVYDFIFIRIFLKFVLALLLRLLVF